ncbi:astacin-like metalloendopeptidase [Pseudophryne corroboree]|uniref:astacin-like metalloendopeptidase n=1 Tax=Pseudophryne corroboree TaxID=495146 RepID=UPI0030815C57
MASYAVLLISAAVWTLGLTLPLRNDASVLNVEIPKLRIERDIVKVFKRNIRLCDNCKWEKSSTGIVNVPYVFSSYYTDLEKQQIVFALQEFSLMTCVQFKYRTNELDYLSIEDGIGCLSWVGRKGGLQTVSFSRMECIHYGIIQHEAMHNIGLMHEHTRMDRDSHVDIIWQYISKPYQRDFQKFDGKLLDLPYDYSSVMHYRKDTFTNTTGKSTIVTKPNPSVPIGQRYGLSNLDVKKINKYYDCTVCRTKLLRPSGRLSSSDVAAEEQSDSCLWLIQVPYVKVLLQVESFNCLSGTCSAAINVYDGVNTESPLLARFSPGTSFPLLMSSGKFILVEYRRDNSTTSTFDASFRAVLFGATLTKDNGTVVSPKYPSFYPNNVNGTWIIIAPPGYSVSLTFPVFNVESSPSCSTDYLAILDGGGVTAPVLGTYCGKISGLKLKSSGQMMVLHFSSNLKVNKHGFQAKYSFVSTG